MDYDLELERVVKSVKDSGSKTVCIQLPDGLKPKATYIADIIESSSGAKVFIWLGSCFGACDIPKVDADLLIQWGHSAWGKLL